MMPKKHNDVTLKEALKMLIQSYKLKGGYYQTKISKIWADKMGSQINKYTVSMNLRKKKLFVTINSAPLRQELSMGKSKIIKMLNEELEENFIQDIIFK